MKIQNKQIFLLIVSLLSLTGFIALISLKNSFAVIDKNINLWTESIRHPTITLLSNIVHYYLNNTTFTVAAILLAVYLFYKNKKKDVVLLTITIVGNVILILIVRYLFPSTRPLNELIQITSPSYPSGHTANTLVLFGILTYFIWKYSKSSLAKILSCILFIAITSFVGFSRIYLNVHWFSDILGGYLLGIFSISFSILLFNIISIKERDKVIDE